MAQHTILSLADGVWTELSNADISTITFQNLGQSGIAVVGSAGPAPTDFSGSVRYTMGAGEFNISLSEMSPGITATRVWAYATEGGARVSVSHA